MIVGGVPPFGGLINIDTFFDEKIGSQERAAFNCGMKTESIIMKAKDLIKLAQPKLGTFAK